MFLLVNDDGIQSPGLLALYQALRSSKRDPVLMVAPSTEQSGQSQAITLKRGLEISPVNTASHFAFCVDGTPTDCLKIGLKVLCPKPPKLIISGINNGPNVGRSLAYSGTVGAAMEAAMEGFPAIAISHDVGTVDHRACAEFALPIILACLGRQELTGQVLNLNLPALPIDEWKPLVMCPHGRSGFDETYKPQRGEDKRLTWHIHGERVEYGDEGFTDAHALKAGHPTITFLKPDFNTQESLFPNRLADKINQLMV